jgi:outer membrane lipoprotein-sorting protein
MRNFIVLGASALVLALGVAQASAIPTTEQWQDHLSRMSTVTAPYGTGDLRDFRAQAVEQGAQVNDQAPSLYHRGR